MWTIAPSIVKRSQLCGRIVDGGLLPGGINRMRIEGICTVATANILLQDMEAPVTAVLRARIGSWLALPIQEALIEARRGLALLILHHCTLGTRRNACGLAAG